MLRQSVISCYVKLGGFHLAYVHWATIENKFLLCQMNDIKYLFSARL